MLKRHRVILVFRPKKNKQKKEGTSWVVLPKDLVHVRERRQINQKPCFSNLQSYEGIIRLGQLYKKDTSAGSKSTL